MNSRSRWAGMWLIVRFNWPLFVTAITVAILAVVTLLIFRKWIALAALGGCLWFLGGSLFAAHVVYDRSDLRRGDWFRRATEGLAIRQAALCHCGYDDLLPVLRSICPEVVWRVLDHYDEIQMSEPSIHRARKLFPPTHETTAAHFSKWPLADESCDAVFGLLAMHELRRPSERSAWFSEARRCSAKNGRVVILEHLRDVANFAAFGPGFVHFHSADTWKRDWENAGLQCLDAFQITPFVRAFVLFRHV